MELRSKKVIPQITGPYSDFPFTNIDRKKTEFGQECVDARVKLGET